MYLWRLLRLPFFCMSGFASGAFILVHFLNNINKIALITSLRVSYNVFSNHFCLLGLFIKSDGSEVDRIVGYRPVDVFLGELERIKRNEGTIDDLSHRLADFPENNSLILRIAEKYEDRGDLEVALPHWEKLAALSAVQSDLARYKISYSASRIEKAADPLTDYLGSNPSGPFTSDAYRSLRSFYRSMEDTSTEIQTYVDFLAYLEREKKLNLSDLNGYAWRMTQLEQNLDDALIKIRQAVKLVVNESADTRAGLIDTEAEVLWKLGRIAEAVAIINRCIELQPEDEYFKDQKAKFLKS